MASRGSVLRVGQINLGRSRLAMDEIRKIAREEGMDVLMIQEPYSVRGKIQGFGVNEKVVAVGNQPMAAIVVFAEEVDCVVLDEHTNSHCVFVEIVKRGVGRVILVAAYFQYGEPIEGHLDWLEQGLRGLGAGIEQVLIGADVNGKSE